VRLPINAEEAFWAPGAGVTVPPLLLLLLPVCERDLKRFIFIFYF
jgi:hypothetical protein